MLNINNTKLNLININSLNTNREILVQNEKFKTVYFKFEEGKGLPNHTHNGYAAVYVLEGSIDMEFANGEKFVLNQGDFLPFDARIEHNVIAKELSKILVIISKPLS
ncbi:cupin domain-containing protein [Romboutsia sedimentorum]|uniref:Cupin domain-containing protein n=1 Tax=Romboutsia sedimentorum TaxID=1368474 RepID=A0ABT7EF91_9FIRM|nr:cupin domain-containing protein [Romboutsia sedimentorum]MDK2564160.1 cupin domain-containing protein [Romboutsia sedimentorum]